ncbi:hypothetical protein [Micromonospora sp. L5]|uniref:hypothetical protein n=1 Tax=Micromonospora sp. (strain L5) TaxID=648999 RepID=UPI00059F4AF7|nr:hypothetical protein [Micromonospora sp. L5]
MIGDSIPWREELVKVADRLERRRRQRRWHERTYFLIERDIMISAYAVRKLSEAGRLSRILRGTPIKVTRYELVGQVCDQWHTEFWESFDMESPTTVNLSIADLCNQIIHSFVWRISVTEVGSLFDGIYVSSDRQRRKFLYFVSAEVLIHLFREVGEEDIVEYALRADAKGERYIVDAISAKDVARGHRLSSPGSA